MQTPDLPPSARPEVFVRLAACAKALGLDKVEPHHLRWAGTPMLAEAPASEVGSHDWWQPYEVFRGAAILRPWAISHLNYLNGVSLPGPRLAAIDPQSFYRGLADQFIDTRPSIVALAKQAEAFTVPEQARAFGYDQLAIDLEMLYAHVDTARFQSKLIVDSRKIRRLWKAA